MGCKFEFLSWSVHIYGGRGGFYCSSVPRWSVLLGAGVTWGEAAREDESVWVWSLSWGHVQVWLWSVNESLSAGSSWVCFWSVLVYYCRDNNLKDKSYSGGICHIWHICHGDQTTNGVICLVIKLRVSPGCSDRVFNSGVCVFNFFRLKIKSCKVLLGAVMLLGPL